MIFPSIHSNAVSVTFSTGWSNKYGRTGTIAKPVTVGPQVLTRGFLTETKALRACATAVWMVNAGKALGKEACNGLCAHEFRNLKGQR